MRILFGISAWLAVFGIAEAEVINSFTSNITLDSDGSYTVEAIIEYDFGSEQRHGIFRNIRDSHAQESSAWYKERYIELDLLSVTMDGQLVPYILEPYDGLSVRIGDADRTISGVHEYKIQYSVDGAIATYADGNEIYWNVTGDEWQVPMLSVKANIYAAEKILGREQACYSGYEGENASCARTSGDNFASFSANNIAAGQQLTIANQVFLTQPPKVIEKLSIGWLWLVIVVAWFVFLITVLYRWRTEHKVKSAVIAQYEPLPELKPMFSGVLTDFRLDPRDISAGIVYLAEQGFISIKRTEDKFLGFIEVSDYEVTLKRAITETESTFQSELLKLLFKDDEQVGAITRLSVLRRNTEKLRKNAQLLRSLQGSVVKDLKERGYIETGGALFKSILPAFGVFVLALIVFAVLDNSTIIVEPIISSVIASAILIGLNFYRYTKKGYEAVHHLKGFKEFMSVTDKERFDFHNAPEKSPEQFMAFLPYAIAFGVEKKWTQLFDDIQMDPPSWYSSAGTATAFNAAAFSTELGAFTGSFSTSSGSSGGGSSGGGSGGGGGGSW